MMSKRNRISGALAGLTAGVLLAGCQNSAGEPSAAGKSAPAPHGYVEGAEETAEQQSRLVMADGETGAVEVLDLITGDTTAAGRVPGVSDVVTDGRFAYVSTAAKTHVVDGGAWTVDHGDHVHYYRAKIREVGELREKQPRHVHSDTSLTAVTSGEGSIQLFDRTALEAGSVVRTGTLGDASPGRPAVPYREHLLVPVAGPGGEPAVEVRDRDGGRLSTLEERCPELRGEAVTRRGVVFGCADGALLVSEKKGTFSAEKIPYERHLPASNRATDFQHRPGSTTLTAKAGRSGVWLLDVTKRSWQLVDTGPVVAVNTAGEGSPLLALTADGRLRAYDSRTGEETARTKVLSPSAGQESAEHHPVIEVDTSRAYLNDAAAQKVYEIDYNDGVRLARTFSTGIKPTHMVETGR